MTNRKFQLISLILLLCSTAAFAQWSTTGSDIFFTGGNAGIGTTAPLSLLHVSGGSDASLGGGGYLIIGEIDGTNISIDSNEIMARNNGEAGTLYLQSDGGVFSIHHHETGKEFTVFNNGRTGIGYGLSDPEPGAKLAIRVGGVDNTALLAFDDGFGHNTYAFEANFSGTGQNGNWVNFRDYWGNEIQTWRDGNIGIGTESPNYKLDVNGTIRAEKITVVAEVVAADFTAWPGAWSDHVFQDDYKLMKLEEVETFIDTKGHLPEIPSAAEVKADGISLGEMDAKLLQKIEELTLYMLELKKENEKQADEIAGLKLDLAKLQGK